MTRDEAREIANTMRAQGKGNPEVAAALTKQGYRSIRTGKPPTAADISYLVTNVPKKTKEPLPAPSYLKIDNDTPPPPAATKPAAAKAPNDSIMVIIARPSQLKDIAGDLFK